MEISCCIFFFQILSAFFFSKFYTHSFSVNFADQPEMPFCKIRILEITPCCIFVQILPPTFTDTFVHLFEFWGGLSVRKRRIRRNSLTQPQELRHHCLSTNELCNYFLKRKIDRICLNTNFLFQVHSLLHYVFKVLTPKFKFLRHCSVIFDTSYFSGTNRQRSVCRVVCVFRGLGRVCKN